MNITEMTNKDVEKIEDHFQENFDDFWNYEILKDEIANNNSKYIVAKTETGEIIGFAGIKIILNEAEIMNIVVHKNYRNNGIGSELLEKILDMSKILKIEKILLEVNENNENAIKLYKKYNFTQTGIRKKYYNNLTDAILMEKAIN